MLFAALLVLFGTKVVLLFLPVVFVAILAVSVCPFWGFSFSNFALVLALTVRKYYCLDLAFSPCVFLAYLIFFTATKYGYCSGSFVVVFLAVFLDRAVRFFLTFCCTYFARLAQEYIRWTLCNFCCINDVVFVVFWGLFVLLLFLLGIPP